ncbi:MAG: hypothetical protein QM808_03920 [Steroidobacteraceae bacterium]
MATRRAFLQAMAMLSAAAEAVSLDQQVSVNLPAKQVPAIPLHTVIVDTRFEASIAFGAESQRLGTSVNVTRGDVTRLWYQELQPLWQQSPVAIAGLTAHGPLFCLERWAWDHGMRVVFRADHLHKSNGVIEHSLSCAEAQSLLLGDFNRAGPAYPIAAARAAHQCPRGAYQVLSPEGVVCSVQDREPLISWVIAPIERAYKVEA